MDEWESKEGGVRRGVRKRLYSPLACTRPPPYSRCARSRGPPGRPACGEGEGGFVCRKSFLLLNVELRKRGNDRGGRREEDVRDFCMGKSLVFV